MSLAEQTIALASADNFGRENENKREKEREEALFAVRVNRAKSAEHEIAVEAALSSCRRRSHSMLSPLFNTEIKPAKSVCLSPSKLHAPTETTTTTTLSEQ